jgi:hypothetical protein
MALSLPMIPTAAFPNTYISAVKMGLIFKIRTDFNEQDWVVGL